MAGVQHDEQHHEDFIKQRTRLVTILPPGRFACDVDGTGIRC
jgi:hypothetical protein